MAVLAVITTDRSGVNLASDAQAADVAGDSFLNDGQTVLAINNQDVGSVTVTIAFQVTLDGVTATNRTVTVPAGETVIVGAFPPSIYNDTNGKVQVTYSGVTSLFVVPLKVGT